MSMIDFPDAPTNGQSFRAWAWNSARSVWDWNVAELINIEYLVIAGGGAGSSGQGGGGGGGGSDTNIGSYNGGSGIVILKYPSDRSLAIGPGLTFSTATVGGFNITSFTAGSDTVTIS
jgi:hypothetical protein